MNFNHKDVEPLDEGRAPGEVIEAENATNKERMSIINLKVMVKDRSGRQKIVTDVLTPKMLWKVQHFCEAAGLDDAFASDKLDASDCIGKKVDVMVKTKAADGQYRERDIINDYLAPSELFNDDLPSFAKQQRQEDADYFGSTKCAGSDNLSQAIEAGIQESMY